MLSSAEAFPIPVVTIGDAAEARVVVVAAQHGNEPAGREAALRFLRDVAMTPNPIPVVVIPTANPYGVWAGTRMNAAGVDLRAERLREPRGQQTADFAFIRRCHICKFIHAHCRCQ